jgi:hypothetical protein
MLEPRSSAVSGLDRLVENLQAELIRRKGREHEQTYLGQLFAEGRDVAFGLGKKGLSPNWDCPLQSRVGFGTRAGGDPLRLARVWLLH